MNICQHCGQIVGSHYFQCTRIEYTGNIQVHHPVRPVKP